MLRDLLALGPLRSSVDRAKADRRPLTLVLGELEPGSFGIW